MNILDIIKSFLSLVCVYGGLLCFKLTNGVDERSYMSMAGLDDLPSCQPEVANHSFSAESHLINCMLERYERVSTHVRPVRDSSSSVVVYFGISLIQILDFDEIKQVLTTSMWKNYLWEDQILRWDPAVFSGITHIRLPSSKLWTPDIVLYNNADEQVKQHEELVAVYYNGTVKWIPPAIYRSSCEIDMADFPFDQQTCFFKFASWSQDEYKVDLRLEREVTKIDFSEYLSSSEWDLINSSAVRNVRMYQFFDDDPYPEIIYTLTIQRQSTFYIYLLVLPCVLLSALTLVLFWIPAQRPDRTAVGMSLFSSFFILLLILVQSSPPTSASISRLGIHYCVNMVMIALSTILSVVVINMGQSTDKPLPAWATKSCLDVFARLLCITLPDCSNPKSGRGTPLGPDDASENGLYMETLIGGGTPEKHRPHATLSSSAAGSPVCGIGLGTGSHLGRPYPINRRELSTQIITQRWHMIAAIVDRIFFIIYLVIIITSTVYIFPHQ